MYFHCSPPRYLLIHNYSGSPAAEEGGLVRRLHRTNPPILLMNEQLSEFLYP